MSQEILRSPGVFTKETDLSQPSTNQPSGVPAGVVGTANHGPAFVPITVANYSDFSKIFGRTDGESFGLLAMHQWLRNSSAGTYLRVLGIGDGNARVDEGPNAGKVNNAGFVVGDDLVQANGFVASNPFAEGNFKGRTYFVGSLVKDTQNSNVLKSAAVPGALDEIAHPIVHGIVMTPSGVHATLATNTEVINEPDSLNFGGAAFGDVLVNGSDRKIIMILNGHKQSDDYPNVMTASLQPGSPDYFANIFNTDPLKIQESGHYLYASYELSVQDIEITGSGVTSHVDPINRKLQTAFCLHSSADWNSGSIGDTNNIGSINFESFEDRFESAYSPWIISQDLGDGPVDLFRFHSLDDGEVGRRYYVSISNIQRDLNKPNDYTKFDVDVRRIEDSSIIQTFRGLSLNPSDDRFIAKAIGDLHTYYDFDKLSFNQKLVVDGFYENQSTLIRVEVSEDVMDQQIDPTIIPMGFRGLNHLVTNGTDLNGNHVLTGAFDDSNIDTALALRTLQPPIPFRDSMPQISRRGTAALWGVDLRKDIINYLKYFPDFHIEFPNAWVGNNHGTLDKGTTVLDADRFNNNKFTLENIAIIVDDNDQPLKNEIAAARHIRNGQLPAYLINRDGDQVAGSNVRFVKPEDFNLAFSRTNLGFAVPMQGGFSGTNLFDRNKSKFSNIAVVREFDDVANQGGPNGPTISAYRKAIQIMEEKSDVDIKLLTIPGIRHQSITDFAIDSVEKRFDAMYIMDIEERNGLNEVFAVNQSSDLSNDENKISVEFTAAAHTSKNFDTSFAAAYFPDVNVEDPTTRTIVRCPPSVAVLGAFGFNDRVGHPWFAPAGFARGNINALDAAVKCNRENLDILYSANINPLVAFDGISSGVKVWGQKTLLQQPSSLDRVNVRRLLIEIRRSVRAIALSLIFDPNREETLNRFNTLVNPILKRVQSRQGIQRYKVIIDTTTTTQADVENNTIRGKIFVQPTKTVEFVSIDFVITNSGEL